LIELIQTQKIFLHWEPSSGAKLAESSGVTHSGEQEGESQPFRGWKGKKFPACEPEKGHCEGREAT